MTLGQQIAELQKLPQEKVAAILAKLPESYRLDISRYLAANKPFMAPDPKNPKQCLAFNIKADEIWYGGAAYGGKTFCGSGMACMNHSRTTIFRRSYEATRELRKIFSTSLQIKFGNSSRYVLGGSPTIIRPPTGKMGIRAKEIILASLTRPSDIGKFQGNSSDFYFFDEAAQFSEAEIRMVQAWLRPGADTPADIQCQMLCTFNPPMDAAGLWVISYLGPWLDSSNPHFPVPSGQIMHRITFEGRDYWFSEPTTMTENPTTNEPLTEAMRSMSVVFIQALPTDNSYLDETTKQRLLQHPEAAKLYYGNMSASLEDNPFAVVKLAAYKAMTARAAEFGRPTRKPDVLSIDPALTGDDMAIVPIWVDECYFGAPVIVPGPKIKGQVENVLHWLEHHFENSLTDYRLVIDGGGTVGGAVGQLVKQAMADKGVDASRLYMFDGSKSTKWKEYQDPDLPSANLFKPRPFLNRISAAWITLGQRGNYPNCPIKIEGHNQYQTQLCVREIKQNDVTTVRMESKEDFKARLGRSPDAADALTMGYYFVFYELPYENYNPYTPQ